MLPIWLSVVFTAAGFSVWMLTQKDYNIIDQWKNTAVVVIVTTVAWLAWWKIGIPFLNWEAGEFNIGCFGISYLVPSLLDHFIPQLQK